MAKISPDIKEYIRNETMLLENIPTRERNARIIQDVKDKFNFYITSDDIYEIAVRSRKLKEAIEELNEQTSEKKLYDVVGGMYHFIKDDVLYKIAVEEIDEMFYDFSKH